MILGLHWLRPNDECGSINNLYLMSNSKWAIRKQMVAARSALSQQQLQDAAINLARIARLYAPLMHASSIASYVPIKGEIAPHALIRSMNIKQACIPVICDIKTGKMKFCSVDPSLLAYPDALYKPDIRRNDFGIPEPILDTHPIQTRLLDAVLVPLAAFDRFGSRLGLGAGFYDRAFEYRLWNRNLLRPLLVGIAHEFQEVDRLDSAPWDVPLDVIITPKGIIRP